MKIQRSQLKEIIKECIREMASEGGLNEMFASTIQPGQQMLHVNQPKQIDPRVRSVAAAAGKTPKERALFESILSDTLETATEQQSAETDPNFWNQDYRNQIAQQNNGMVQVPQIGQMMGAQQAGYGQQHNNGYGYSQQPQMQAGQQQPNLQSSQGYSSPWARLAFNSPINNRPKDGIGGGGSSGFLPGMSGGGLQ